MNRRRFLQLGATGSILGMPKRYSSAQAPAAPKLRRSSVPDLVSRALTQPNLAFPSVVPLFAGLFVPGNAPTKLVRSESWSDFTAQAQSLAGSYKLSCFTSIQNLNRTWYYGAFQPAPGAPEPVFFQSADAAGFQAEFAANQGSSVLVDFSISWQDGQLLYSGACLPGGTPNSQLLLLDQASLPAQQSGMQIARVQAYPKSALTLYAALFTPGTPSPAVLVDPVDTFAAAVASHPSNTLLGLAYDPVEGRLIGVEGELVEQAQFFIDEDWNTLTAMAANNGLALQSLAVYPDAPSFGDYFETNLAPYVMGYSWAAARNGQIIADGGGFARSSHEADNPGLPFTADSRLTLASVSKAITGVALETLILQTGISLDDPFLPLLGGSVSSSSPVVATITLRDLASMQSGLFQETNEGPPDLPPADANIMAEINAYLAMPPAGTPGQTYYYDNTNFTILQAVIEQQSGTDYTTYVTQNVLVPAGMNTCVVSPVPDPESIATLIYSSSADTSGGYQYPQFTLVGVSGWISSVRELVKLLAALRGTSVLPQSSVGEMFADNIGWNLPGNPSSAPAPHYGNFGVYYWKEGGLTHNGQSLQTFVVRLAEGYDLAVLVNSPAPISINTICFNSFDARGLSTANLPEGGPTIQTVVNGASYLPAVAPGSFVSIFGSGFTSAVSTDWTNAIGSSSALPTELGGVEVRVGSVMAYVEYVSAGQVNVLLPAATHSGIANVELTTPDGGSTASLNITPYAPGLFTYTIFGKNYAIAIFGGIANVVYVAATGAIPGVVSRPANAGDVIQIYGSGMGATNPPWPDGMTFQGNYPVAELSDFQVAIGGVQAQVLYAAMVSAGVYQINIVVPAGLTASDQLIAVTVNGTTSQPSVLLTMG